MITDQLAATPVVPRHRSGASLREEGSNAVLEDRSNQQLHRLNPTALAIWELCDGDTTVPEMVAAVSDLFAAASVEQLQRDVVGVLRQLTTAGLVEWVVPSEAIDVDVVITRGPNDDYDLG